MRITRYETLMIKIEELAKEPEKNSELLDKLSNKLAAQKFYLDNIDTEKVEESIKNGNLSYEEYRILKNVLEEKKLYNKNSEKIEEVINGNYENIGVKKRVIKRKVLKTAAIIATGVLLAVGIMSCSKKTTNDEKYNETTISKNEKFEENTKKDNNNKNADNDTNNDVNDNSTNNSDENNTNSNESLEENNKNDEIKDNSKEENLESMNNANNSKEETILDESSNTGSNNNTDKDNVDNNNNNNNSYHFEKDEEKERKIDKMIEEAGKVTSVETPSAGEDVVVEEENNSDNNIPLTEENIDSKEEDITTYEIEESTTEIKEVKPEEKNDSVIVIESSDTSLENLPIEENEADEITYDIFSSTKTDNVKYTSSSEKIKEESKDIEIPSGLIELVDLVPDDENETTYDIFEESTISMSL